MSRKEREVPGTAGEPDANPRDGVPAQSTGDVKAGRRLAYVIFLLLGLQIYSMIANLRPWGIGALMPWNAMIAAADWWETQFAGHHMNRYITIVYLPVELAALLALIAHHDRVPLFRRLGGGYGGFLAVMAVMPGLVYAGSSSGAQAAILSLTVVLGVCDGCVQGGLLSLASKLPGRYVQAAATGLAWSGVTASALRCITKAALPNDSAGIRTSAVLFFALAAGYMAICLAASVLLLPRLPVVVQRLAAQRLEAAGSFEVAAEEGGSSEGESGKEAAIELQPGSPRRRQRERQQQHGPGAETLRNGSNSSKSLSQHVAGGPCLAGLPAEDTQTVPMGGKAAARCDSCSALGRPAAEQQLRAMHSRVWARVSQAQAVQEGLAVARRTWVLCAAIFLLFAVTFSIFPGVMAEISGSSLGSWYPVLLIALFNLGDLGGRTATGAAVLRARRPGLLLAAAAARVGFAPAFYFAASKGAGEVWMSLLSAALGSSNGYFTVCAQMRAPELVPPAAASLAGDIMVLFLIAGLNLGAGLGFLWLLSDSA